ncbi:uncharacterized protein LOC131240543 isoform X2 [Magnolia sinica]|uniref:uncharacterized protein LOC131240543 isoform X2 n=1 Tax=Magnolia sinica TaxID=86752 RepID=UPI002658DDCA|nr:uncharacterized protein LOC131240543 isoform X2 [Magnolia sinica]
MEGSFVNLNEDFHEKELMMLSSEEGTRVADDNGIVFSASKLKMVLDKIIQERSITPDIKNQRHLQECLQTPCGKEHRIPKYVSLDENLLQRCLDLVEAGASDSLSIICRATTAFGVPANLRSSKMEVLCDSLKPCRRKTTSTGDQGNYFVGCTRAACPRNEITSPIGPLIFDTAEGKYKEPQVDMLCMLNELDKDNLLLIDPTPNLELAAIVVKDHHHDDSQETGVGGWGLNFLKKVGVQCGNGSLQSSSESCEGSCLRNENEGLMSMDVLVPAAFHGGPRSKIGGPSSLTQRWRSGGHCDCGGWDIGCPLTVLNTKSRKAESPSEIDAQEDCRSFDLFIEGAKQGVPALTMVNVHEGLYYIHFQSTLSALQSFSIGVAIIHAQTPSLRSKSWRG